ncbi:hypothetical protein BV20DRAFT_87092 [Pilatotrama ljubarskyi]|nr:hypothetical protein BV20DRAFT_87092 [Pilatotrama ljubarskyi]
MGTITSRPRTKSRGCPDQISAVGYPRESHVHYCTGTRRTDSYRQNVNIVDCFCAASLMVQFRPCKSSAMWTSAFVALRRLPKALGTGGSGLVWGSPLQREGTHEAHALSRMCRVVWQPAQGCPRSRRVHAFPSLEAGYILVHASRTLSRRIKLLSSQGFPGAKLARQRHSASVLACLG